MHALVNFEFSDKYLTPRGMIVQDEGVVFQPLVLGFANVYAGDKHPHDAQQPSTLDVKSMSRKNVRD